MRFEPRPSSRAGSGRGRLWRIVEGGLAAVLIVFAVTLGRTIVGGCLNAILGAAVSFFSLLRVDPLPTAWTMALALGRIGLAMVPSVVLVRSVVPHRRIWLGIALGLLAMMVLPVSLTACPTISRWLALAFLSALASLLVRWRLLAWAVVLPYAVLLEVVPSHGLLNFADVGTRDPRYRAQLLEQCKHNSGTRPINLDADRLQPYHGINLIGGDLVFLAGEGPGDGAMAGKSGGRRVGSWWLRRADGGWRFEQPSQATGNLWRGCLIDQTIWLVRAGRVIGVRRTAEGGGQYERIFERPVPSTDMDLLEAACDRTGNRVYVTEFFGGGVWEVPLDEKQEPQRHQVGGVLLIPEWRFDGKLVLVNSSSLLVFDPDQNRVVESVPARLGGHGFDVCETTGAAAVADLAGRVRVFELDQAGHYQFAWGVSVFAPRRVAFSSDCSRIGVTSADDHRVYIVDAAAHRVTDVFHAGPALRDVAPTGPREFSVSDVCSITTFGW
jgi:hypothetical protein